MSHIARFLAVLVVLCVVGTAVSDQDRMGTGTFPGASTAPYSAQTDSSKTADTPADTLPARVIKKDLIPREQLVVGSSIMAFIIVVMALMNNFNPE